MIKIIAVGKIKKSYLLEGINYYIKQIPHKTEIIEVQNSIDDKDTILEGKRILEKITDKDYVIALAIKGNSLSSEEFAKKIDDTLMTNSNIVFVIGGSNGLSEEVLTRSNYELSFSKMTFPHQLMRLILVEQIFRAISINNHHPYHK